MDDERINYDRAGKKKFLTKNGKMIPVFPNQRVLQIRKQIYPTKRGAFTIISNALLFDTMQALSPYEFYLWIYLTSQADTGGEFTWLLSKSDFISKTGLSKNAYFNAFRGLNEKNYLMDTGNDKWIFISNPNKAY